MRGLFFIEILSPKTTKNLFNNTYFLRKQTLLKNHCNEEFTGA